MTFASSAVGFARASPADVSPVFWTRGNIRETPFSTVTSRRTTLSDSLDSLICDFAIYHQTKAVAAFL